MNIKQYEEEVKKGCKEIQKQYEIAQTIPLHKDFVPSVNTIINYEILEAKLGAIQKCKEMFKENINESIHNFFNKINWIHKNKGEIEPEDLDELKEELLSQLNGEEQ